MLYGQNGRENGGYGDGNEADVFCNGDDEQRQTQQKDKQGAAESQYDAAETGKPLAAAEPQCSGEHMPQNDGGAAELTGIGKDGDQTAGYSDSDIRLENIKQSYKKPGFFPEKNDNIGGAGVARTPAADIKALFARQKIGGIDTSDKIRKQNTGKQSQKNPSLFIGQSSASSN